VGCSLDSRHLHRLSGNSLLPRGPRPRFVLRAQILVALIMSLGASGLAVLVLFFRDPQRTPPVADGIILSPADGKIIYIRTLSDQRFPTATKMGRDVPLSEFTGEPFAIAGGMQFGIMMSYVDVHVNRSPISGRVERVKAIQGGFSSLKYIESLLTNERVFTIISSPEIRIGLVQIASRLVRRIVSFVQEGDDVGQGDRIGMIRFGSQVDLLLPKRDNWDISVKVGDYVKAGLTILARYEGQGGDKTVE
jgi:phosphatidylserine decarboxylase